MSHELSFRANALEKHDELELKEDDGVNGGTPTTSIGLLHKLAHKRQVTCSLQVAIEVILWHQLFQRHIDERGKGSLFHAHHNGNLSSSHHSRSAFFSPPPFSTNNLFGQDSGQGTTCHIPSSFTEDFVCPLYQSNEGSWRGEAIMFVG